MSKHIDTVQQIYAAFGRGDVPAILGHMHPDVVWEEHMPDHGIPWLTPGKGVDAVGRFFQNLGENIQITGFEVNNLMGNGNQVCGLVTVSATGLKSGKSMTDHEVHVWTFEPEGRVIAFRHVADTLLHKSLAG